MTMQAQGKEHTCSERERRSRQRAVVRRLIGHRWCGNEPVLSVNEGGATFFLPLGGLLIKYAGLYWDGP